MALPDRDSLLDLDWLTRTQAAETAQRLRDLVRDAADVYGGPVTAIAEALIDLSWGTGNLLQWADLRHGLAHALASGSWSTAPTGDRTMRSCSQWLLPALQRKADPGALREKLALARITCVSPPLPDLATLRLASPLDRAWVTPFYGIWGCGVSPDDRYVISGSRGDLRGGHLIVWDGEHGTKTANVIAPDEVRDCAVSMDGRYVISQNNRGSVAVWTLPALTLVGRIEGPRGEPAFVRHPSRKSRHVGGSPRRWRRFAVSADAGRLAVAGFDTVRIYTLAPLEMSASVDGLSHLPHGILALGFVGVDRLVIVGRKTPMPVWVWDLNSRRMIARRDFTVPPIEGITRAIIAPDNGLLVAGGDRAIVVWRLDDPSPVAMTWSGISGQALAVSADATMAATSGPAPVENETERVVGVREEQIRLWSLPDLREIHSWSLTDLGCRDIVTALAFSPDNRHLIVGGWEGVLRRLVLTRGNGKSFHAVRSNEATGETLS